MRPDQVRLPTDRVRDPREGDTFLLGQPYRPGPVEPAAPAAIDSQAAAPAAGPPQAAAGELPATEGDGYEF